MMPRALVGSVLAAALLGVLAPSATASAAAARAEVNGQSIDIARIQVPRLAPPRLREVAGGYVVDMAARLDVDEARVPRHDRARIQLAVASPVGSDDIVGPEYAATVAGGVVEASLELTDVQADALRLWTAVSSDQGFVAGAVKVGIRHEADVDGMPGIDAIAVQTRRAAWNGARPTPPAGTVRGYSAQITFENTTGSPLSLLAGPVSCMWDSNYPYDHGQVKDSDFLAQSNGAILLPGQSFTTASSAADSITDSKYVDTSADVLSAYTSALTSNVRWYKRTSQGSTIPDVPSRTSLPVGVTVTQAQLIRTMVNQLSQDALDANATFDKIYDGASGAIGIAGAFAEYGNFFDLDVDLGPLDQIFAIVGAVFDAIEATCGTGDSTLLVGATDITHPWRQFVSFYEWNGSRPEVFQEVNWLEPNKPIYAPYANGMLVQVFAAAQPGSSTVNYQDDYLNLNFDPTSVAMAKQPIVWSFSEPDINADNPAVVNVSGRTLTCGLDPRDQSGQALAMRTVKSGGASMFLTGYPVAAWQSLDSASVGTSTMPGGGTGGASAYVDGMGYAAPGTEGVSAFYYSADGVTWSSPQLAPANSNRITLPASVDAALVQCTTQSVETYNGPITYNGRRVIMGTRVMSDIVLGPDAD